MKRARQWIGQAAIVLVSVATWGADFRVTPLQIDPSSHTGFSLLTPGQTGITFTNELSQQRYTTNQIYLNGSGAAAGDVDGDGRCDLFFSSISGASALYRNLGDFHFTNVTHSSGLTCAGMSATGAAFADLDGDGDLDLVVNSVGEGTHLFLNDGHGHFTQGGVLNQGKAGMSLAIADFDGDGALDLYICNYRTSTLRDQPGTNFRINMVDGKPVVASVNGEPATLPKYEGRYALGGSGNIAEFGEADALYRNDGSGHFTVVPFTGGAFLDEDGAPLKSPPYDWSLSAMFRDLNGDGRPDLYVCSDFDTPDRVWLNQGNGRFQALSKLALRNTSRFSMGVDVADINRDGFDDIFVLDMLSRNHVTRLTRADKNMDSTPPGLIDHRPQFARNTLQLSRGDGTFSEIAYFASLEASEWSWTPIFLDVDLDGFEDLLISTGHGRDDMDIDNGLRIERTRRSMKMLPAAELALRKTSPVLSSRKLAFRNDGQLHFRDVSADWGFNQAGISHGMCLADLDGDGDLDLVVNNLNAGAGIYRNDCPAPRILVRLQAKSGNTHGIGARVELLGGAVPTQTQEIVAAGRYLSSDESVRVFAAGAKNMTLRATWPDGTRTIVESAKADSEYVLSPGATRATPQNRALAAPLFEEKTLALNHNHHEEPFDDFARQALLPNRLSQLGPAVAWFDFDQDGRDDLLIGSGRGGQLALYHNDGDGAFTSISRLGGPLPRDAVGIVAQPRLNGEPLILVAFSNYEDAQTNGSALRVYDHFHAQEITPPGPSSLGALALAEIDPSGSLALFAAGRVVAGRFPEPASSTLYRFDSGHWVRSAASDLFTNIGLVSAAVWTDLNGDGLPELVVACEWGPIRIFANENGALREATADWGMADRLGWWSGVTAGDFDGDGRMDLVAANWGLNSKYRVGAGPGPRLYWSDWGAAGEIEPVEASYDPAASAWFPERDLNSIGRALPGIREKFQSHRAFAEANVVQIFGTALKTASHLEVNCLESTVFLNRGDHFEARPLPAAAQFSPGLGVNVADFDGDGREDLFLSQNFFDVNPQTSRLDAGRGLLLKGEGNGQFTPVDGAISGIKIYGEQRGSAAADYDSDGRVDLVVTQNGAATTLWHNIGARRGLRVRLRGSEHNPSGIGARMRLHFPDHWGPVREIHAGSGYWSQDSAVQVLSMPTDPTEIEVRWPGGHRTVSAIPARAHEIEVEERTGVAQAK